MDEDNWLESAYESANGADVELESHDQIDDEENEMDPNQTLRDLRAAIAAVRRTDNLLVWPQHALDAVDAAQSLDDWLSDGGFLPADWNRGRS